MIRRRQRQDISEVLAVDERDVVIPLMFRGAHHFKSVPQHHMQLPLTTSALCPSQHARNYRTDITCAEHSSA
uniref:Uncharacterized protein n=1 Tax=Mycena chlorophos TaxID=658473 RepID=A0ABQ0LA57_MYCCL|nr:predicted protein [Mycena chlorophos]